MPQLLPSERRVPQSEGSFLIIPEGLGNPVGKTVLFSRVVDITMDCTFGGGPDARAWLCFATDNTGVMIQIQILATEESYKGNFSYCPCIMLRLSWLDGLEPPAEASLTMSTFFPEYATRLGLTPESLRALIVKSLFVT